MFCAIEEPAELLFELGQQVVPGVGGLAGGHFFGCAGNDQRAAAVATLRAEVYYVVGGFYHVEVMLDYHHCVAVGYEPAEGIHQHVDVVEMQAGGRLVEYEEGGSGFLLRQEVGEFHSLVLAARECG